jgi:hypothetical protein
MKSLTKGRLGYISMVALALLAMYLAVISHEIWALVCVVLNMFVEEKTSQIWTKENLSISHVKLWASCVLGTVALLFGYTLAALNGHEILSYICVGLIVLATIVVCKLHHED